MKRSRSLPGRLCFPLPPARIDWTLAAAPLPAADAASYLANILRWREAVQAAIVAGDPAIDLVDHFSPRARSRLAMLLETRWDSRTRHWAAVSNNDLTPFHWIRLGSPADDHAKAVLDVLHWRAAVVDYLTDVWDSPSTPELEMGECAAIGAFIRPARLEGRCVYCLTKFPVDRMDPEDHGCIMARHAHAS
jgi:hypothetical protein